MWEDGNNLTSNLFTLITPLTKHKNTSDIHVCSYKPYTENKTTRKKNNIKKIRKKLRKKIQKLCDMYIDKKIQVQKKYKKNNNIAFNLSKAKKINLKHSYTI